MSVRETLVSMGLRVQCYQRTREPGSVYTTEENAGASRIVLVQEKTVGARTNTTSRCHSLTDCGLQRARVRAISVQAFALANRSVEAKDASRQAVVLNRRTRHGRCCEREVGYFAVADGQGVQKKVACDPRFIDVLDGE